MRINLIIATASREQLRIQGSLALRGYDNENFSVEVLEALLSEPFVTRGIKTLIRRFRRYGFFMYGISGVDVFPTSELLYPTMNITLRLIIAMFIFYMICDTPNVPTLVLKFLIVHSTLSVLLSRMII